MRTKVQIDRRLRELRALALPLDQRDPIDPGQAFIGGYRNALSMASDGPLDKVSQVRLADTRSFVEALLTHTDDIGLVEYIATALVDLDEIPDADADPDVNCLYGRLAGFEWIEAG